MITEANIKTQEEIKKVVDSVMEIIECFTKELIRAPVVGYMEPGPAQVIYLNEPDYSGVYKRVDLELNEPILIKAFNHLIEQQEFLRSCLVIRENTYQWQVHEFNDKLQVPIIDLSSYTEYDKEQIINECISIANSQKYEMLNTVQYRICIIKESPDNFILMIPVSHIIFDAISAEILMSNLFHYYQELLEKGVIGNNEPTDYAAYLNQMRKGPLNIDENQLMSIFNIQEFYQSTLKIKNFLDSKKIELLLECQESIVLGNKDTFLQAIDRVAQICMKCFHMQQVPLWVVNMGRIYENNIYNDVIGSFIDFVPFVYERNYSEGFYERMQIFNTKREKNINFLMFITKEWYPKGFEKVSAHLTECHKMIKILFNFIGEMPNDEEFIDSIYSSSKNNAARTILFTTYIKNQRLYITCNLSKDLREYDLDMQKILIS